MEPEDGQGTWEDIQWLDMTDEHFIVWMRAAAQSTFRKLWGRINVELNEEDEFYLQIQNNYSYQGEKKFVLSTISGIGGKDSFLATCYIVMAVFCALVSISFCTCEL